MRGPRDVNAEVSAGTGGFFAVTAGADSGVALAGAIGAPFLREILLTRRVADNLCERFSFKTRRQNRMSPDGEALIPFWESSSLMARYEKPRLRSAAMSSLIIDQRETRGSTPGAISDAARRKRFNASGEITNLFIMKSTAQAANW